MRKLIWLLLSVILFSSCEKIILEKDPVNNPVNNFDILWNTLDKKYSLFTFKNIDWQKVYDTLRPRVHNEMSDYELFEVMNEMLYVLKDGHTSLTTPFDRSRNWEWYLNSPPNFDYNVIERNYLGSDYRITGPLFNKMIDSVAYIYYGSFSNDVSESDMDFILHEYRNAKGLIIDVRNNTGGNTENIKRIAGRFTTTTVLTGYWLYKTGPGHNDFSIQEAHFLEPQGSMQYNGPVVVLTNSKCYSATNDFVSSMKSLPNVISIGDTTGGGGGLPFNAELPNGWQYRFSSTMSLTHDGFNVEAGIAPDIPLDLDPALLATGKDNIIERAIAKLKK